MKRKPDFSQVVLMGITSSATVLVLGLAIFSAIIFLTGAKITHAATTYETDPAVQDVHVNFPSTGGFTRYAFRFQVPVGTTFDRIQMQVPPSQTTAIRAYISVYNQGTSNFNSCVDNVCVSDDFVDGPEVQPTSSLIKAGTVQFNLGTTTTVSRADQYVIIVFDPNTPLQDFFYTGATGGVVYSENGFNNLREQSGPVFKMCHTTCDDDNFHALPALTATPWVRIVTPTDQETVGFDTPFTIQANTGTSTADHVEVKFTSQIQDIPPYSFDITSTGLNTNNFTELFPRISDDVAVQATLYSSTTVVATSPFTILHVASTTAPTTIETCDKYVQPLKGLCTVFKFLFVPSESVMLSLMSASHDVAQKPPFGYVTAAIGVFSSIHATTTQAFNLGDVPFVDTIFTPINGIITIILWLLYAVFFYRRVTGMTL